MADITLQGNPCHTNGELPAVGAVLPAFSLVDGELNGSQQQRLLAFLERQPDRWRHVALRFVESRLVTEATEPPKPSASRRSVQRRKAIQSGQSRTRPHQWIVLAGIVIAFAGGLIADRLLLDDAQVTADRSTPDPRISENAGHLPGRFSPHAAADDLLPGAAPVGADLPADRLRSGSAHFADVGSLGCGRAEFL